LAPGHPYVAWTDIIANGRFNSELLKYGRITLSESYAFALEQPLNSTLSCLNFEHVNPHLAEIRLKNFSSMDNTHTLIMPSAVTVKSLPQSYWIDLFNFLSQIGQNPIIDSTFVEWDVTNLRNIKLVKDELINFVVEKTSAIVGLRSGMLDLLGGLTKQIDIKVVALYPVDSEQYNHTEPGHSVKGFSKGGINLARCWDSKKILDIEVHHSFKKEAEGKMLEEFLVQASGTWKSSALSRFFKN